MCGGSFTCWWLMCSYMFHDKSNSFSILTKENKICWFLNVIHSSLLYGDQT
jgi:hypothetical protein